MLKSPTITVLVLISPFIAVNIHLMYWGAPMWVLKYLQLLISSWIRQLQIGTCHLPLYKLLQLNTWFSTPPEKSSGWGAETGTPILVSPPCLEKHWNPSWWHLLLVTSSDLHEIACTSPSSKITYLLTCPPNFFEQFLRAVWGAVSWVIVLILPQIKLDSQLSNCAFI